MNLVLISTVALGLSAHQIVAQVEEERAVVDQLKKFAKVYVGYVADNTDLRVSRIDLRVTGEKDEKEVVAALKQLKKLPRLETIMLLGPAFTDDAVKQLAKVKSLRDVQIYRTKITDDGIKSLASLPEMRRLIFQGNGLSDEGLKDVAQMTNLQYLEITDAPVTDNGIAELSALQDLRRLSITNSRASPNGIRRLFDTLPNVEARPVFVVPVRTG
jgi:hypothetical protein